MFTATRIFGSPRLCQCAKSRAAWARTHLPTGMIRPVCSSAGRKGTRRYESALRVAPAQQRFDGDDPAADSFNERLIVNEELPLVECQAKPLLEHLLAGFDAVGAAW